MRQAALEQSHGGAGVPDDDDAMDEDEEDEEDEDEDESDDDDEEHDEDAAQYARELAAEVAGVASGDVPKGPKSRKKPQRTREEEEKELAMMMMTRKKRRLFDRMQFGIQRKAAAADTLKQKRAALK
jgi:pescadillo protein